MRREMELLLGGACAWRFPFYSSHYPLLHATCQASVQMGCSPELFLPSLPPCDPTPVAMNEIFALIHRHGRARVYPSLARLDRLGLCQHKPSKWEEAFHRRKWAGSTRLDASLSIAFPKHSLPVPALIPSVCQSQFFCSLNPSNLNRVPNSTIFPVSIPRSWLMYSSQSTDLLLFS